MSTSENKQPEWAIVNLFSELERLHQERRVLLAALDAFPLEKLSIDYSRSAEFSIICNVCGGYTVGWPPAIQHKEACALVQLRAAIKLIKS